MGGDATANGSDEVWVFAYGSLMWRPCFAYLEKGPALLKGYHRAFCVYSLYYRGTPEAPGLVLGLERGGSCRGMAFRVAGSREREVLGTLDSRENIFNVYERRLLPVGLPGRRVMAYAYVADRRSPQYAGKLPPERVLELLLKGRGNAGTGADYLESTVRHLDALGIPDKGLHELLRAVEGRRRRAGRRCGPAT